MKVMVVREGEVKSCTDGGVLVAEVAKTLLLYGGSGDSGGSGYQ